MTDEADVAATFPWDVEGWDPNDVIERVLLASARGEGFDHDEALFAADLLVASTLIRSGMSADVVDQAFAERGHTARLRYIRDTDSLEITINWEDGPPDSEPGWTDAMTWRP